MCGNAVQYDRENLGEEAVYFIFANEQKEREVSQGTLLPLSE